MPELPEVETVRRELEPWLASRRIRKARRADAPAGPKYANLERADGQRIEAVTRRGKFLILPLSGGDELIIHLGMTGRVLDTRPDLHLRVIVDLEGPAPGVLYFQDTRRFGRFLVAPGGDRSLLPTLHAMGPEPLDPGFTPEILHAGLQTSGPLKPRLMSQRAVAGLGNIYVDEALWRTRLHPLTTSRAVSLRKARELHAAIVDILSASIAAQGTTLRDFRTVGGEVGAYVQSLQAYGRQGEPCDRCGQPIRRVVVGQRSTHFCGRCQRRKRS